MSSLSSCFARIFITSVLTLALAILLAASTIDLVSPLSANAGRKTGYAQSNSHIASPQYFPRVRVSTDRAGSALPANSPFLTETRLSASDGAPGNKLGSAIAVSGNTAAVADTLSLYVFVRLNGVWTEQQKLSPAGLQYVAIDGNTLIAASGNLCHVFVRIGTVWTSQQVIDLGNLTFSVSISGDTIVAGTPWDSEGCPATSPGYRGAALVFARTNGSWTQQQKLTASDGACAEDVNRSQVHGVVPYTHPGDSFGESVSVDHDTILVGAGNARMGANVEAGAAYVFGRNGSSWSEQQKLRSSSPSLLGHFREAVAISNDSAVIGAPSDTGALGSPYQPGSADAFGRSNGTWTAQQHFAAGVAPNCTYDFARSVAVSGDTVVVGCDTDYAPDDPSSPPLPIGSASWFKRSGSGWIQQPPLLANDGVQGDNFGHAVAVSGPTILVGAPRDDTPRGPNTGSAYAYEIYGFFDPTPPVLTVPANISTPATSPSGAIVHFVVTATDNDDPSPVVVSVPASGSLFPIGTTTVHSTATDASGNSASADFLVNVLAPTPTPNPCLDPVPPTLAGSLRKSVALGNASASNPDAIGSQYDLLFRYNPPDPNSPCATNPAELDASSNVALLKNSGTTWVKLWVDWATLEPYSPLQLLVMANDPRPEVREFRQAVIARKETVLRNLDAQIRTAHKEKLQVILTVNHRYPLWASYDDPRLYLPLPPNPSGTTPVPGCEGACRRAHDPRGRVAFGKVPLDFTSGGPWAQFIALLVERYGLTKSKIDRERLPCSYNFLGEGCSDYFVYVDFLEVVNEPNLTHWPQRNPDKNNGSLSMPGKVAQMFVRAQSIVEARNRNLRRQAPPQLDDGMTTVKLLGPATADISKPGPNKMYKSTSYYEFTRALFARLKARDFDPGPNFAWSHHNYLDVEYARHEPPRRAGNRLTDPDECATNSAAWARRLLNLGDGGYQWEGWPSGNTSAELLITESGARLVKMPILWPLGGSAEFAQAALVEANFKLMNEGRLGAGIAMFNNYLTYSDPSYDTGLLDYNGASCVDWHNRANCSSSRRRSRVPCRGMTLILPCVCSGFEGEIRPVYEKWKVLVPTR